MVKKPEWRAGSPGPGTGIQTRAGRLTLIEPRCQGSLIVHTDGLHYPKSRLVFLNPASLERDNMTARLSHDEGKTWPFSKQLTLGRPPTRPLRFCRI